MFTSLARQAARRPRRIALLGLLFFLVAAVLGGPAAGKLNAPNPFLAPGSESSRAQAAIQRVTGAEAFPGVLALIDAGPGSPRVTSLSRDLRQIPGVSQVEVPTAAHPDGLVAENGRAVVLAVSLRAGADADTVVATISSRVPAGVLLGGGDVAAKQVDNQAAEDLGIAELIAFPLLALICLLIFRGIAALLPLAVGGISIVGAFLVLSIVNGQLALSNFALNLVIGVGLGLAVDYSLLLVWRFREQLSREQSVEEAMVATLNTAGATITYSALTVAAAMLTLTIFPQRFLISMGIGGAAVALVAGLSSLLVLPSLLVLLAGRLGKVRPEPAGTGRWYGLAHRVMKRPVLVALVTTVGMLVIASPTVGVHWSGVDAGVLPRSQSARIVQTRMDAQFPRRDQDQIVIAAHAPAASAAAVQSYANRVTQASGAVETAKPRYLGSQVWRIDLGAPGDPIAAQGQTTVSRIRAVSAPFAVEVTGAAAQFLDQKLATTSHLVPALLALVAITLLLLWLMTGSVILPIKALLLNGLTAATATGALVFIFQHGRLSGLLDYTSQGGIEQSDFLILVAVGFALSTDYSVLLLSRIKEARDRGEDNREAIALGLQRTGRIVSASAVLMAVAIGAFATSHVVFLKEIGVGAVVAVLMDAFVVRCALVPSLMVMLGEWNWWSPAPLARLHRRIGLSEAAPAETAPAAGAAGEPGATLVSLSVGE